MSRSIDELLQNEQVTFCVDTNILIEFQSLGTLPWREIAPEATSIRIIVPTKVGAEMDEHKFGSSRLRKRAAEFSGWARRMETDESGCLVLKEDNPRVTIEFGPLFRTSDLDADHFDLADGDNRIVAEVARIAMDTPDVILLADDSLPIRLARQFGLAFARPPTGWRRPDGPDQRDQEISELKRQLGPQPEIVITLPGGEADSRLHVLELPPTVICQDCENRIVAAVLALDPRVPRSVLEKRYPTAVDRGGFASIYIPPIGTVTSSSLDQYEEEFKRYKLNLRRWASSLPALLTGQGTLLPLEIDISNKGTRAAEKVHAQAELTGKFHFEPIDRFDTLLEDFLEVPSVPEPYFPSTYLRNEPKEARPRVDKFYLQDKPEPNGSTQMISWRCEELRQNTIHKLPALIVADEPDAEGALTVRSRGASIANEVSVTAPLRAIAVPKCYPFHVYLRERLELVPFRYQEALRQELAKPAPKCTCEADTSDRQ